MSQRLFDNFYFSKHSAVSSPAHTRKQPSPVAHCIHVGGALLHSDSAGNDHHTRFFQLVLSTMKKKPPQTALLIWHLNRTRSKCLQLSHVQPVSCHISANSGWVLTMDISLSTQINARLCTGAQNVMYWSMLGLWSALQTAMKNASILFTKNLSFQWYR